MLRHWLTLVLQLSSTILMLTSPRKQSRLSLIPIRILKGNLEMGKAS